VRPAGGRGGELSGTLGAPASLALITTSTALFLLVVTVSIFVERYAAALEIAAEQFVQHRCEPSASGWACTGKGTPSNGSPALFLALAEAAGAPAARVLHRVPGASSLTKF
jgi:hypothetical protein